MFQVETESIQLTQYPDYQVISYFLPTVEVVVDLERLLVEWYFPELVE